MKKNLYLLLVIYFLPWPSGTLPAADIAPGTVYINEFMAVNVLAYGNSDGEYEDWIEFYNNSDNAVNLAGYIITDDPDKKSFIIPSGDPLKTIIPAKSYRLFFADEKTYLGANHLPFKLNSSGDRIFLINSDGVTIIDSISFGEQLRDVSFGRSITDINQWGYTTAQTAGKQNNDVYPDFIKPLNILQPAGIYSSSVIVYAGPARDGEEIHYTLDGSIPGMSSPRYTGPVTLTESSIFSVRAFRAGYLPSETTTKAFLINIQHVLPVLSILTDPKNFYDPATGIYVNDYDGRAWERFCNVEYFKNNTNEFSLPAGIRIQGNSGPRDFNKKSFRLFFREEFNEPFLNYEIYKGNNVERFSRLVLRSGYDDNLGIDRYGVKTQGTLIRDPLVTGLWQKMGELTPHSSFTVLYLNNLYHGIYDIKESIDEDYIKSYEGSGDVDIIRTRWDSTEVTAGDKSEWNRMLSFFKDNSFAEDDKINEAEQYLDLDNFINLYALAFATGYKNWAYGVSFYRVKSPGEKWKIIPWDADRSYFFLTWDPLKEPYNPVAVDLHNSITLKLLENTGFRNRFIAGICDHLNSVFLPEKVNLLIDSLANAIEAEIPADAEKWKGTLEEWKASLDSVAFYASSRPQIVRSQIKEYFNLQDEIEITIKAVSGKVIVNNITPEIYPWKGKYFGGVPLRLTAIAEPGYMFAGWSDPKLPAESTVTFIPDKDITISAMFIKLEENNLEVIAPRKIRHGGYLPYAVRLRNNKWEIKPSEMVPVNVSFNNAAADTVIKVKRGAGAGINLTGGPGNFLFQISGNDISPFQKLIYTGNFPVTEYSGALPAGVTIWDSTSDRLILSDITIPAGSKLIIKPGTWVYFKKFVNIYVSGSIEAEGTAEDPIVFISENMAEPWGGIEFTGSVSSFSYCMFVNGAGDAGKGHPTNEDWHTGRQHMFFGKDNCEFDFNNCFFLFSTGKVFGMQDSKISVNNSLTSFVWHGGEFHRTLMFYRNSHLMNLPNDDHIYTEDIDTDGMHIDFVSSKYKEYSVIDKCFFVTGKDDAIDHHEARLKITNCWLEDFIHEGVAASGKDTIIIFNTIALKNDQAFEAGWSNAGAKNQPHLIIDHCVAVDNNVGLRIGDGYSWNTYNGYMKVTNTVLYNNKDNIWNYILGTQAPLPGAVNISYSMTNDAEYDTAFKCITGEPVFDEFYYLIASSPGTGAGTNSSNMGRADSASLLHSAVVINEIMYNSPDELDTKDWIELYNPQKYEVDISGWVFKDNDDTHAFIVPEGTSVLPGGFIVLCNDTSEFRKFHLNVNYVKGNFPFGIGEEDIIRIYNSIGELADIVSYKNSDPWPDEANGRGYSLELLNPDKDNYNAINWGPSGIYGGTPGNINTITGITEEQLEENTKVIFRQNYPNPFNAETVLQFVVPLQMHVKLAVYDILGRQVMLFVDEDKQPGTYRYTFNSAGLASGIYFAHLTAGKEQFIKKLVLIK